MTSIVSTSASAPQSHPLKLHFSCYFPAAFPCDHTHIQCGDCVNVCFQWACTFTFHDKAMFALLGLGVWTDIGYPNWHAEPETKLCTCLALLLGEHMWLLIYVPCPDGYGPTSCSHGGKGSLFDAHCQWHGWLVQQFWTVLDCTARQTNVANCWILCHGGKGSLFGAVADGTPPQPTAFQLWCLYMK